MKRVFGKKKATAPTPSLDQVSGTMGNRVGDLDTKISKLDKEMKMYKDKIKGAKNASVKKTYQKRAMDVLKRKRMYEQQRDQIAGQQFNLDQAAFGIESAKANIDTVAAMKTANTQLKQTLKTQLNINEVDDLADDMADLLDEFNEINDALGRNFATPDDIDEAELDAELELLEDELEDELLEDDAVPSYLQETTMPVQPSAVPIASKNDEKVDEFGLPITN